MPPTLIPTDAATTTTTTHPILLYRRQITPTFTPQPVLGNPLPRDQRDLTIPKYENRCLVQIWILPKFPLGIRGRTRRLWMIWKTGSETGPTAEEGDREESETDHNPPMTHSMPFMVIFHTNFVIVVLLVLYTVVTWKLSSLGVSWSGV